MKDVRQRILDYLRDHITLTLATCLDGDPHAATLFFANDGFDLIFLSSEDTVHSLQALANERVFVTVSQDYADWKAIQGLQLRGRACLLSGSESDAARLIYVAKFPFVASFPPNDARFWRVRADWVRFTDNTLGFAHKDEIDLRVE